MAVTIAQTAAPAGGTGTIITYAGASIGTAAAHRVVAVPCTAELTNGQPLSATINSGGGAVAMNASTLGSQGGQFSRMFWLLVPTGTTADIIVTYNSTDIAGRAGEADAGGLGAGEEAAQLTERRYVVG